MGRPAGVGHRYRGFELVQALAVRHHARAMIVVVIALWVGEPELDQSVGDRDAAFNCQNSAGQHVSAANLGPERGIGLVEGPHLVRFGCLTLERSRRIGFNIAGGWGSRFGDRNASCQDQREAGYEPKDEGPSQIPSRRLPAAVGGAFVLQFLLDLAPASDHCHVTWYLTTSQSKLALL